MATSILEILEQLLSADLDPQAELQRHLLCGRLQALVGDEERARHTFETAAAMLQERRDGPEVHSLRAQICLRMAELLERRAPGEALTWIQRGLDVVPRHERRLVATFKILAGTVNMHMGNFGGALEMLHDGLETVPSGMSALRINALKNLGAVYFNLGQLAEAADYSEQALTMSKQLRDHLQTARVYINLGPIKYVGGDWQGAVDDLEKGLAIAQRLGSLDVTLSLYTNLGGMYVEKGDHAKAFRHLNGALRLTEGRHAHQEVTAKIRLAQLYMYEAKREKADATLQEAETLARRINDQASLATILGCQAIVRQGLGDLEGAQQLVQDALALDKALGYQFSMGQNLRILGSVALARNDIAAANEAFAQSLEILEELDPYQAALTQLSWGEWLTSSGERERGIEMLMAAQRQFEALGAARELVTVRQLVSPQ
jgi:tetratricopeptide (TPR) repeat protein